MPNQLHVIYIPGLGDINTGRQQKVVDWWRRFGVDTEILSMRWSDKEPWEPKFERLLKRIDQLNKEGKAVGLVGISAGATAVINAFAVRQKEVVGVVCVAGKILRPENINKFYHRRDPAFVTSAFECEKSLIKLKQSDRRRILCLYGLYDETVSTRDSRIEGAINRRWPMILHVPSIATAVTAGAPGLMRFLKNKRG
jgi:dienelactone hydrolase